MADTPISTSNNTYTNSSNKSPCHIYHFSSSPPTTLTTPTPQTTAPSTTPRRNRHRNCCHHNQLISPPNLPPSPLFTNTNGTSNQNYDSSGICRNVKDSLAIIGLALQDNITQRHIRRRNAETVRNYRQDKNSPEASGRTQEEATRFFQPLNNAQAYLRDIL